jgi:hypothetical protein
VTVSQAILMERSKRIFMKSKNHFSEAIGQLLGIFHTKHAGHLIATAWAIDGEQRHFVPLFVFAALGYALQVISTFLFLQAAATGMIGPPLG